MPRGGCCLALVEPHSPRNYGWTVCRGCIRAEDLERIFCIVLIDSSATTIKLSLTVRFGLFIAEGISNANAVVLQLLGRFRVPCATGF